MQTFLPYPDFYLTVQVLDRQRLGKQRVEVLQILKTLAGESDGWKNHPAVKMWKGYEPALIGYGKVTTMEWKHRGYKDTCCEKIYAYFDIWPYPKNPYRGKGSIHGFEAPPWFGDEAFHLAHQSNLVRKMPEHYRQFWPDVPDDLPYMWPTKE